MKTRIAYSVQCATVAILLGLTLAPRVFSQSRPSLSIQLTNASARLNITADIGSPGTIQYVNVLSATNQWLPLTNYTLLSNPLVFTDTNSPAASRRIYRVLISAQSNMLWIPAGTFVMGSPTNELRRDSIGETQHTVTLTRGFYAGKYLVTQSNYLSLISTNPSYYKTNNGFTLDLGRPVEQVSWNDATNYCAKLTQQERAAGRIFTNWLYRLPTEAEWEYACRAGTTNAFYYGPNLTSGMANFDGEFEYYSGIGTSNNVSGTFLNRTVAVGGYQPNTRGLYDMAGNVWEWCQDWFAAYTTNSVADPQGPGTGTQRVFRGGSLNATGALCRSADRNKADPSTALDTIGFRVVLASQ